MIDDFNDQGTQWARFSDDRKLRYRLARVLPGRAPDGTGLGDGRVVDELHPMGRLPTGEWDASSLALRRRVVFVMLNPSTADAFILDPTVKKCVKFATAWRADVVEVVNIFPLRSTDPDALKGWTRGLSGAEWGMINDANRRAILLACRGAERVVAAWGKHGAHLAQGAAVRVLLHENGIKLHCLATNNDGSPKHPLYVKDNTMPKEWTL